MLQAFGREMNHKQKQTSLTVDTVWQKYNILYTIHKFNVQPNYLLRLSVGIQNQRFPIQDLCPLHLYVYTTSRNHFNGVWKGDPTA